MDHVIQIEQMSYRIKGKSILKEIDWTARQGEHWAILGLNGSGKTTLLNIINGYIWPSAGSVSVLGRPFGTIDLRELRTAIGWVSSSLQGKLYPSDRAEYIVVSGKYATIGLYEDPSETDWELAESLMEQLGCAHLKGRTYQTCSQGEQQKLLIARALMAQPKLLILDEPCSGLDLFAREQLLEAIETLAQSEGAPTLLYVTHHTEEILPIFQHALLLRRGEVFCQGKVDEVLNSSLLSDFFERAVEVVEREERYWLLPAKGDAIET
ncbi:molybdenum ABC transporter ATP-binding protein [Ammoniphilus oxalaticus]|uniref:Molybdenum ABC transporter ATP-binding protein n=1 Tax=Ammoniphilus oxalaticus TaxID=66863 RepID=A0A419SLM1_9BACL|nr:ABC transporter ATP-binding protein [Ammoniphilus oxalaticus]RKD24969.1 molybdenum ABC transporter ATP-binding protein [Ammoniphilus oxalaticus]